MKASTPNPRVRARSRPIHPVVKADTVNPSASAVVERYAYDGFGREISAPPSVSRLSSFAFSTKQLDGETGMNYYGYRFYAADAGRWINRDPILEKGGDNVYVMVGDNLVAMIDVNGLATAVQNITIGIGAMVIKNTVDYNCSSATLVSSIVSGYSGTTPFIGTGVTYSSYAAITLSSLTPAPVYVSDPTIATGCDGRDYRCPKGYLLMIWSFTIRTQVIASTTVNYMVGSTSTGSTVIRDESHLESVQLCCPNGTAVH